MRRARTGAGKGIKISTCFSCKDADGPEPPTPRRRPNDFSEPGTRRLEDPISRLPSHLQAGAGRFRNGQQTTLAQSGIAGASPIADPELEGIELESHTPADSAQPPEGVSGSALEPPIVASSPINRYSESPSLTLPMPNHPAQESPLELSALSPEEHEVSNETRRRHRKYSQIESSTRSQELRQHRRRSYLENPPRLSQPGEDDNLGRLAHPPFGVEHIFPLSQSSNESEGSKKGDSKANAVKDIFEKGGFSEEGAAKGNGGTA